MNIHIQINRKSASSRLTHLAAIGLAFAIAATAVQADDTAKSNTSDSIPTLKLRQKTASLSTAKTTLVARCPSNTTLSPFDMPIYDTETGTFVVGFETVWFCLPANLEPEG